MYCRASCPIIRNSLRCIFCLFFFFQAEYLLAIRSDSLTAAAFRAKGIPFYGAGQVDLLPTGIEKFDDMLQVISEARQYIHMDYFKFQNDSICQVLFDILRQKASEGVNVRVVYDSFGNKFSELPLSKGHLDLLRNSGVEIYEFDRMKFPWIHHAFHRDHHKITVIDGKYIYTGGMNVADYYLHGKPKVGEWRDMHIRMTGSVVEGYGAIFNSMWKVVSGQDINEGYEETTASDWDIPIALVDRIPRVTPKIIRETYCIAIDNAQHLIQIVNPYPTMVKSVRRALFKALDRGVRVQFMVSTKSDGPVTGDVSGIEMLKLKKRGAEIYYYNGGFHHSKVMMIDSLFCTVGTANLDARSLKYDYEVNSYIFDQEVTRDLQAIFQQDVEENCDLLTKEEKKKRFPLRRRIKGRMLGSIRGLL